MPPRMAPARSGANPPQRGRGRGGSGASRGGAVAALGVAGEFIYICKPLS